MENSVKKRLLSDVPLGVFLSGGLDSSTIVGFVAKHYPKKVQTFTIGYKDKSFSELPFAKKISDFFGTEHNVLMIDPISPDDIEKSLYHLDEPMTDLSTIPFHLISQLAKEKVKVCLSGEGGDEVFLGYDRFKASKINRYFQMLPSLLTKKMIPALIMKLPDQPQKKGAVNMLKRFIEGTLYPDEVGAMRWQYFLNPKLGENLFRKEAADKILFSPFSPIFDLHKLCESMDPDDLDIFVDLKLTMADSVLMKVDKMSMATSLEVRVPFLDHELVELMATVPPNLKLKYLNTKYILRKALKDKNFFPEDIIQRGKQGYSLPLKNWLREELRSYMESLLSSSPIIKEVFNQDTIKILIKEHVEMTHNHNHILWALINLALWYKQFFL